MARSLERSADDGGLEAHDPGLRLDQVEEDLDDVGVELRARAERDLVDRFAPPAWPPGRGGRSSSRRTSRRSRRREPRAGSPRAADLSGSPCRPTARGGDRTMSTAPLRNRIGSTMVAADRRVLPHHEPLLAVQGAPACTGCARGCRPCRCRGGRTRSASPAGPPARGRPPRRAQPEPLRAVEVAGGRPVLGLHHLGEGGHGRRRRSPAPLRAPDRARDSVCAPPCTARRPRVRTRSSAPVVQGVPGLGPDPRGKRNGTFIFGGRDATPGSVERKAHPPGFVGAATIRHLAHPVITPAVLRVPRMGGLRAETPLSAGRGSGRPCSGA